MLDCRIPMGLHFILLASLINVLQDTIWIGRAPLEPATCLDQV